MRALFFREPGDVMAEAEPTVRPEVGESGGAQVGDDLGVVGPVRPDPKGREETGRLHLDDRDMAARLECGVKARVDRRRVAQVVIVPDACRSRRSTQPAD